MDRRKFDKRPMFGGKWNEDLQEWVFFYISWCCTIDIIGIYNVEGSLARCTFPCWYLIPCQYYGTWGLIIETQPWLLKHVWWRREIIWVLDIHVLGPNCSWIIHMEETHLNSYGTVEAGNFRSLLAVSEWNCCILMFYFDLGWSTYFSLQIC